MDKIITKDATVYCSQGPDLLLPTAEGALSKTTFVFKDLFDVEGYVTGAGNPAWLTSHGIAKKNSKIIEDLLANGATCVGRVQTDELAYSLNGQNIHYGTPINPVAPECLPGGSSSGSAVTVARGESDFSIGTDTGGSVRVPASYCGLFGLRPTLGKLDLENAFQLSESFDTAGIFSRDLTLLSNVFSTLTKHKEKAIPAKRLYLDNALTEQISEERLSRFEQWCQQADITLIKSDFLAESSYTPTSLSLLFRTIQGFEIIQGHDDWLKAHGDSLDPSIMERVEWARSITAQEYSEAKRKQAQFKQSLVSYFQELDGLWALPTTPSGPPLLTLTGEPLAQYRSQLMGLTSIAGLSGLPQLHLPIHGLQEGPCGFSLMSIADSEARLISTGLSLSQGEQ